MLIKHVLFLSYKKGKDIIFKRKKKRALSGVGKGNRFLLRMVPLSFLGILTPQNLLRNKCVQNSMFLTISFEDLKKKKFIRIFSNKKDKLKSKSFLKVGPCWTVDMVEIVLIIFVLYIVTLDRVTSGFSHL